MHPNRIRELTIEYGGDWEINHVDRVLKNIEIIGKDQKYDKELVRIAAHLHDWGAFEKFMEPGKDHAVRSREVAVDIIKELDEKKQKIILDAISEHNTSVPCSSMESTLLRDADNLDFLGFIGIARDFVAKGPKDIKKCLEFTKKRIKFFERLILPESSAIGKERLNEMHYFIERVEAESSGHY